MTEEVFNQLELSINQDNQQEVTNKIRSKENNNKNSNERNLIIISPNINNLICDLKYQKEIYITREKLINYLNSKVKSKKTKLKMENLGKLSFKYVEI